MDVQEFLRQYEEGVRDFPGVSLINCNLSETNLQGVNFKGATLTEVDFREADLREANFEQCNLTRVLLQKADLRKAKFTGGTLLNGTNLSKASLKGATLSEVSLERVHLNQADLREINLIQIRINNSDLSGVQLTNAIITDVCFHSKISCLIEADLSQANLSQTDLYKVDLQKSDLTEANLTGVNLTEANLTEAKLIKANLTEANLSRANLTRANLTEANLTRIKVQEANFEGANLTGACLQPWNWDIKTNLNKIICKYFYLEENQQKRCPDINNNYRANEFVNLCQKVHSTIPLIFLKSLTSQSFKTYLQDPQNKQKLIVEYSKIQLSISSIYFGDDDSCVIKVNNLPSEFEESIKRRFEKILQNKDEEIENLKKDKIEILKNKNEEIKDLKKDKIARIRLLILYERNLEDWKFMSKQLASKTEEPNKKTMKNPEIKINNIQQTGDNNTQQNGDNGIGRMSGGEIKGHVNVGATINNRSSENHEELKKLTAEIKSLLENLQSPHDINTISGSMNVAADAIEYIESDRALKEKVLSALREDSILAFQQLLNHPAASFFIQAAKKWLS